MCGRHVITSHHKIASSCDTLFPLTHRQLLLGAAMHRKTVGWEQVQLKCHNLSLWLESLSLRSQTEMVALGQCLEGRGKWDITFYASFLIIITFLPLMISQGACERCQQIISGAGTRWPAQAHSLLRNSPTHSDATRDVVPTYNSCIHT